MIQHYTDYLIRKEAEHDLVSNELEQLTREIGEIQSQSITAERARDIANAVLLLTQDQVKSYIEEIVSLALSSVYPGYSFELEYEIKCNQSEATPWIIKYDDRMNPRGEVGGGVIDIVSLGLRFALWSLSEPKPPPIFILDEPAKFVSRDKQEDFGAMLREVSKMLSIQILIVSHSTDIVDCADSAFVVEQERSVSHVRALE